MKNPSLFFAISILTSIAASVSSYAQNTVIDTLSETTTDSHPQPLPECVILLHGLARTSKSMIPLRDYLQAHHYVVVNVDYPSREFPIATLTEKAIPPALANCREHPISGIHFVTHSLGGILVRQYLSQYKIPELKRVVMFAPPNKGSQVVDKLKNMPPFDWLNGPAGNELGTERRASSVVLMITGRVMMDNVREAARMLVPNLRKITNMPRPNSPYTTEGIPARLIMAMRIRRVKVLSGAYSTR